MGIWAMVKIIVDICRPLFSRGVLPLGCGKCAKHCIGIGPPKKEYTCNILLYIYAKLRICNRRQCKTFEFWSRSMKNLWVLISVGRLKGKSKPVFPLFYQISECLVSICLETSLNQASDDWVMMFQALIVFPLFSHCFPIVFPLFSLKHH